MNSRAAAHAAHAVHTRLSPRSRQRSAEPILTWRATEMRSRLVLAVLMLGFLAIIIRSFILQHVNVEQWQNRAEKRFERTREVPAARGRVLDRNGAVIASSIREELLGIVPSKFKLSSPKVDQLAVILGMRPSDLKNRIAGSKGFFYLARGLNLEQADKIRALRLTGVELEIEYRRHYPYGDAFAHAVGFSNAEDRGAEGIERAWDADLRGVVGLERVFVDRRNDAFGQKTIAEARPGKDLQLSFDAGLQVIVQSALRQVMDDHRPRAASAVVVDVQTGEVLALANEPSFDPNNRVRLNADTVRNRVLTDIFEPGSTLKPFSVAAALQLGRVTPSSPIQTDKGKYTIGSATISDTKPHGTLTVEEVLQKSSNVGTVKVAQRLHPRELHEFYSAVGFGTSPQLGISGMASGRLRPYQRWVPIDHATISYGHGVSVSLIQLARAYSVFARDGELIPLSFVRQDQPVSGQQIFSATTARSVRQMLEAAAGPNGTAPKAQIPGFRVAGKTGTAHKPEKGGYASNRYVSSFVGFAPADRPKLIIAVMVDEPSNGKHYGGEVAAPAFAQIAYDALRRMQFSPNPALRVLPANAFIEEGT